MAVDGGSAPAQNRVSPLGDVIAAPGRGAWMGNRGRLHEGAGSRVVVRQFQSRAWITCRLAFRGWRAEQWHPRHYTPLFFLDEAVALAAGHRPCAECRRADFVAFRDTAARVLGFDVLRARELDFALHEQRWDGVARRHGLHREPWATLPTGAFVLVDDVPAVVLADRLVSWLPSNRYRAELPRPTGGLATVITPELTLEVLRLGYPIQLGTDPTSPRTGAGVVE